jgi:hypothetical protein
MDIFDIKITFFCNAQNPFLIKFPSKLLDLVNEIIDNKLLEI